MAMWIKLQVDENMSYSFYIKKSVTKLINAMQLEKLAKPIGGFFYSFPALITYY